MREEKWDLSQVGEGRRKRRKVSEEEIKYTENK